MSNLGSGGRSRATATPTPPTGTRIAVYGTYLAAQRAVDFLSDRQFPVQHVTIVGTDLQMVERVTGRLTYGRVAMAGAASGAWFGLFVGLLLALFAQGASLAETVLPALIIGAGFGMLFGVLSYAFTGGRRDFTSTSQVVASQYALLCAPEHATRADELLTQLPDDRNARVQPAGPPPGQPHWTQQPPPSGAQVPGTQQGGPQAGGAPGWAPPAGGPVDGEPAQASPQPTGPTYGEMMEKQRRERQARERGEQPPTT